MEIGNKLSIISTLLKKVVDDIDCNNSNLSEEDQDEALGLLTNIVDDRTRVTKGYICNKMLHISSSTFDNYVRDNKIPKGIQVAFSKEITWSKKEIKKFKDSFIKRPYKRKEERSR